jgi:heptosyltransferase-2
VNWLGDAVMSIPALLRLREALPTTQIALLTRAKLGDLWTGHPAIDVVIPIQPGESVWSVGRGLRAGAFDTALVLPNSLRSALEVRWAGIPRRVGYRRPGRSWLLTNPIPARAGHVRMRKRGVSEIRQQIAGSTTPEPDRSLVPLEAHQMHDYLHLAAYLGASEAQLTPRLAVTSAEVNAVLERFEVSRDRVWLGVNAGAEYGPAKRWPKDRFIAAAREAQERTGCGCLVLGGPADRPVAEEIAAQLGQSHSAVRIVAGQTSLRELMALMSHCRAVLTNDTGPMHVAAALGVTVVVPFGSTSPELTGPGLPGAPGHHLVKSDAPCSPCFLRNCPIDFRCMRGIGVERVTSALVESLS